MHASAPASPRPRPGTPLVFQWRKWDGSEHWRHDAVYLGADEWGDWIGQPPGWRSVRPGREFLAPGPNVTLVPRATVLGDRGGDDTGASPSADFALTVNRDHPHGMRIYIDLGWQVGFSPEDPLRIVGIDMDLDVVRVEGPRGTWVDDRDEWEEHAARYGYPADVMAHLEARALELEAQVRDQIAPFDDATADRWLDALGALRGDRT